MELNFVKWYGCEKRTCEVKVVKGISLMFIVDKAASGEIFLASDTTGDLEYVKGFKTFEDAENKAQEIFDEWRISVINALYGQ